MMTVVVLGSVTLPAASSITFGIERPTAHKCNEGVIK